MNGATLNLTKYVYDSVGRLQSKTMPNAGYTGTSWCPGSCGAANYTTTYSTNAWGDVYQVSQPLTMNGSGVITSTAVTQINYDVMRKKTSIVDADGNTTKYTYDADGEATQSDVYQGSSQNPMKTWQTQYDADGNVSKQLNGPGTPTQTWLYGYDHLNRKASMTDPLSQVTSYVYDALGDMLAETDPGGSCTGTISNCTTYRYDNAGRLCWYLVGASQNGCGTFPTNAVGYTYFADGTRATMVDGTGTTSYAYDAGKRMVQWQNVNGGTTTTVGYQYDEVGNRTQISYPNGTVAWYGYDADSRLVQVYESSGGGHQTDYFYDGDSNPWAQEYVTGSYYYAVEYRWFDLADRLNALETVPYTVSNGQEVPGTAFFYDSYTLDSLGQETASQESSANVYDAAQRLTGPNTGVSPVPNPNTYGYSQADELQTITLNTTTTTLYTDANSQLCWTATGTIQSPTCGTTPQGGTTYHYDTRGNRTTVTPSSGSATTLGYDQLNRLTSWSKGTTSATYTYNGDGLRTSKTVTVSGTPTTTQQVWDTSGGLPQMIQDGSTTFLTGLGGDVVEQITGGTAYWYSEDRQGSVRSIFDTGGNQKVSYTYDPYGNVVNTPSGLVANQFRFGGQYQDAESGMYYLRARYLDTTTGQFISRDPMIDSTREPYAYAADTPLDNHDPSGLLSWNDVGMFLHRTAPVAEVGGDTLAAGSTYSGYVGAAAIVLGAILTATGVGAPVGVPLMFAGAVVVGISIPLSAAALMFHLEAGIGGDCEGYYQAFWDVVGIGTSGLGKGLANALFEEAAHATLNESGEQAFASFITWSENAAAGALDPSNPPLPEYQGPIPHPQVGPRP